LFKNPLLAGNEKTAAMASPLNLTKINCYANAQPAGMLRAIIYTNTLIPLSILLFSGNKKKKRLNMK